MLSDEKKGEKLKNVIIQKISIANRERNSGETYFENKKTDECEICFEWPDLKKLGFAEEAYEEFYGLLCEMVDEGFIADIKRRNLGYFWLIDNEVFYIPEERELDKNKGYYFIRNNKRYWDKGPTRVNYTETDSCDDYSGDRCYGSLILPTPPPLIMILVSKDFKKRLLSINPPNQKIQITINLKEKGICRTRNEKILFYKIKGGRASLIKALCSGKKSGSDLLKASGYANLPWLSNEIADINNIFKKRLETEDNLIINLGNDGYFLNQEAYDIEFKK